MTEEVKDWWELSAEWFQDDIDLDVGVNWTSTTYDCDLSLLSDVDDTDVLELGCGGGQCAVALAERGANVTGIDLSEEQLSFARGLADERDVDIDVLQGDVTDLGMFPDDSFDVAFNAAVFLWVGTSNPVSRRPSASSVPAAGSSSRCRLRSTVWSTTRPGKSRGAIVDFESVDTLDRTHSCDHLCNVFQNLLYFDTGHQVRAWKDLDEDMVTYRHTVRGVYDALVDAGFRVERMREPGSHDPGDYQEGPWGENKPELLAKLPASLIFEARAD